MVRNLNSILDNLISGNIAPVIQRSDGLYTVVNNSSITPSDVEGTNLDGSFFNSDGSLTYITILGAWDTDSSTATATSYYYNTTTNKWEKHLSYV